MIKRTAICAMRIQPLQEGHCRILSRMIRDFETAIICIGSAQKSRVSTDPYTFEERKKMVQNVYGDRLKIVQLNDLGTVEGTNDWADYILDKVQKIGLPNPTDYFTGSRADGRWYEGRFATYKSFDDIVNEYDIIHSTDGAQWINNPHVTSDGIKRFLHVIDRNANPIPPATDIRTYLELRSDDWKEWVPRVNWDIVENNFPDEFRIRG